MKNIIYKKWFSYAMIFVGAILYTISIQAFLQEAKIFPTGLGAFVTIITYSASFLKTYFSLLYLLINIPLIIIFWKKVKKSFIYKTLFFLLAQAALGSLFFIEPINSAFTSMFETFKPFREGAKASGWPILIMAAIAALIGGLGIGLAWKFGGSSAGTDIITYYFSTKKQKSIGKIAMIIGLIIALFSFGIVLGLDDSMRSLWYLTLVSTGIYIIINSSLIDFIFPKYSKVKISIHSNKPKELQKFLIDIKFPHAFYLKEITSGYLNKKRIVIETVVLLLEVKQLGKELRKIDPNIWYSIEQIRDTYGKFETKNVD